MTGGYVLTNPRTAGAVSLALAATAAIAVAPTPPGLSSAAQLALATMALAAILCDQGAPAPGDGASHPRDADHLRRLRPDGAGAVGVRGPAHLPVHRGFMLAKTLQAHSIERRLALYLINRLGRSPRLLILAIMLATAFLSMWVSNTATTAMMTPVALGVLAEVVGRDTPEGETSNMRVATLLGTAYAASVGGVGTLIGTPPNVVAVAFLDRLAGVEISFAEWIAVGFPVVVVTLPLTWYVLTFWLYPPEVDDVTDAQARAGEYLDEEGPFSPRAKRATYIVAATAGLWILGGFGFLFEGLLPSAWQVTLFGGEGRTSSDWRGTAASSTTWWSACSRFRPSCWPTPTTGRTSWTSTGDHHPLRGGISLADALGDTNAIAWLAEAVFGTVVGAPSC